MRRTFPSIFILDIFAVGNAEHRVVRRIEIGFGKTGRICGHQWQVSLKSQRN